MTVKSAQSITIDFTTTNPATGAAADATGTPAGTLVVNGTDNGATVTVTNKATGVYKAAVALPALTAGDMVQIRIAATVATVAGVGVVWTDVADTARLSDISAKTDNLPAAPASTTNITAGTMTTVTNLTNLPAAAALEATLTAMKGAGWTTQTLVSIAAQITGLPATLSYDIIEAMIREDSGYAIGDIISGSVVDIVRDTIRGADNDTLKTLSDQIDGVSAGAGLTAQQTRDAMMLAPTAGAPAAGSVDAHLDDILEDTSATLPGLIAAGTGTGLLSDTITVLDGDDLPVDGVLVQVATDSGFSNILRSGYTNGLGQVTFNYDAAGTYYGRAEISGYGVQTFTVEVSA